MQLPRPAQADPALDMESQPWKRTRRVGEQPEDEPGMPPAPTVSEDSMIDNLSRRLWDDRGLRKVRVQRSWNRAVLIRLAQAERSMAAGDDHAAYGALQGAVRLVRQHSHRQTVATHAMLSELADKRIAAGDLAGAAAAYRETLQLGRYLPVGYTSVALNRLINTHFDLGDYEAALMYVRIGIAVLDEVGVGPYLAMNRIIQEMSALEDPIADLTADFDAAMSRLEAAAVEAQRQGLVIEDQWWAPVYAARHDRERAIRLLKDLVRPGLADVLRESAIEDAGTAAEPR